MKMMHGKSLSLRDESYYLQDQKLLTICEQVATPCYLYDLNTIIAQYQSLHNFITWPKLKIFYAMKANYNIDVLKVLKEAGASIDAVSPAEALLALKLGFSSE